VLSYNSPKIFEWKLFSPGAMDTLTEMTNQKRPDQISGRQQFRKIAAPPAIVGKRGTKAIDN